VRDDLANHARAKCYGLTGGKSTNTKARFQSVAGQELSPTHASLRSTTSIMIALRTPCEGKRAAQSITRCLVAHQRRQLTSEQLVHQQQALRRGKSELLIPTSLAPGQAVKYPNSVTVWNLPAVPRLSPYVPGPCRACCRRKTSEKSVICSDLKLVSCFPGEPSRGWSQRFAESWSAIT